jgi:hypothetical protein
MDDVVVRTAVTLGTVVRTAFAVLAAAPRQ